MSIRELARELYRLQREVDALERKLNGTLGEGEDALKARLRKARAERDRMQRILDGRLDR